MSKLKLYDYSGSGQRTGNLETKYGIDYKEWKKYVDIILDQDKLDKLFLNYAKSSFHFIGKKIGAGIKFETRNNKRPAYRAYIYIYSIPTKDDALNIYKYVKEKGKHIKSVEIDNFERHDYVLYIITDRLKVALKKLKELEKDINSEHSGIFDYETATKRFGRFLNFNEMLENAWLEYSKIEKVEKERYKIHTIPTDLRVIYTYEIINIPADIIEDYADSVSHYLRSLHNYEPHVKITGRGKRWAVKIDITHNILQF
ncbi:MAG: hypothetical protein ACP5KS_02955 [Candidatus Hydrogenedens sp.]